MIVDVVEWESVDGGMAVKILWIVVHSKVIIIIKFFHNMVIMCWGSFVEKRCRAG